LEVDPSCRSKWFREQRLPGPVLWYGGKSGFILPHILRMLPITRVYVEPYGGAGSVLLSKDRSEVEVYNDLDWRIVNLLQAIQDEERFEYLYHRIFYTLYSRYEFIRALDIMKDAKADDDDKAWAFFVAQNQGYGGISYLPGHWGRAFTADKGVAKKVRTYSIRVDRLPRQHERLRGVTILCKDAFRVIREYDSPDTTFFLDPPYVPDTRVNKKVYYIDQPVEHHERLVDLLLEVRSAVVLIGYDHSVYRPLVEAGWEKVSIRSYASAAARNRGTKTVGKGALRKHAPRVETVWRNPRACELKPIDKGRYKVQD
jgi:DNA adenine methylase